MTRPDAQDHLDLLARDVASPLPPGLLDTARGARRRRTRGRLAAGGAVVAVAAVALAVTLPGGATTSRPQTPSSSADSTPDAPAGTKWVAGRGYMVAVPDTWEKTEPPCSDGVLVNEGPGFYYLARGLPMNDCLATGLETSSPTVTLTTSREGLQDLQCDPTCSQTVVEGDVELRLRRISSAEAVGAIIDTFQPLPEGWVVDPTAGTAVPLDDAVPDSRVATSRRDLVGEWAVVAVAGGPVPTDAERGLTIRARGGYGLGLSYSDGVNYKGRGAWLGADGSLTVSPRVESTLAACVSDDGGTCAKPHGFGVADAIQARLTADGDLVLVGADGTALAVYEPA